MVTFVYIESRFQNDVTSAVQTIKPELFDFPNSNLSRFGEDVIFGSDLDVLQEVIVEDEAQYDINVDGTSSASPASLMNDVCSNENSMSSFATSETHNRFWTREEDFRSEVLPENFFNETDDDPSFNLDPTTLDQSVSLNEESGFVVNNLFPIKEEVGESDAKFPESTDETLKKAARRRTKQELTLTSQKPKYHAMSLYDETVLLKKLKQLADRNKLSAQHNRLLRKLSLRNTKRSLGMELFNFDKLVAKLAKQEWICQENVRVPVSTTTNVLDHFQKSYLTTFSNSNSNASFRVRLLGSGSHIPQHFVSPYTGRSLTPFIRRDYESRPLKMRILEEIRRKCKNQDIVESEVKPIDYCYVQLHHIPAVNSICKEFFWSGIDVTECLNYPDFTCVVLYGHLIIGFAFMVPDVSYNEAYISYLFTHPDWRGAGIAKFMLYHLIMSSRGKDVTLHVSATNPAVHLYHQFGFKVQEFVADFYDKYYPAESNECRHAFFMRLTR